MDSAEYEYSEFVTVAGPTTTAPIVVASPWGSACEYMIHSASFEDNGSFTISANGLAPVASPTNNNTVGQAGFPGVMFKSAPTAGASYPFPAVFAAMKNAQLYIQLTSAAKNVYLVLVFRRARHALPTFGPMLHAANPDQEELIATARAELTPGAQSKVSTR